MNKLMYRFVTTRKKKKKKEIDLFLDTVCPFRASRVKRNRPVFRHGMPPQGIPRNKNGSNVQNRVLWSGLTADQELSTRNQSSKVSVKELNFCFCDCRLITRKLSLCARSCLSPKF